MSHQAEASLIASALMDHRAFAAVSHKVKAEHFASPAHTLVWASIAAQAKKGKAADPITVFADLQSQGRADDVGGLPGINELASLPGTVKQAERYAEIVVEAASNRALVVACYEAASIAQAEGDLNAKLEKIQATLQGIQRTQMAREPESIQSSVARALLRYEDLEAGRIEAAWSTGIAPLDEMFAGGLRPGKVYGIAARPSVGKSSAARQVALSTARHGLPTLVLSQEMPVDEVTDCLVSQLGHIDAKKLITGGLEREDWNRMVEATDIAKVLPLYIDDDGGLTIAEVGGKARMVKGLKVLVLDYLQLCSSDLKGNTNDQVAEISKGLKRLALQMGIAIVVLSQLNRAVESRADKEPQLSDLRDSGAIEQDLDACVMLWTAKEEEHSRLVGWKVAKNRSGNRGVFAMRFHPATYAWHESAEALRYEVAKPEKRERGFHAND